jgi:hypothetical protein
MVRWSGGVVHEQDGLLFVAGPSSCLRLTIRMDGAVDGTAAEPDDADLAQASNVVQSSPRWTSRVVPSTAVRGA